MPRNSSLQKRFEKAKKQTLSQFGQIRPSVQWSKKDRQSQRQNLKQQLRKEIEEG